MGLWRVPRWILIAEAEQARKAAPAAYRARPQTDVSLLVCGGRTYAGREHVYRVLDRIHRERGIAHVLQDGSPGAAMLARSWARDRRVYLSTVSDFLPASVRVVIAFPGADEPDHWLTRARAASARVRMPSR